MAASTSLVIAALAHALVSGATPAPAELFEVRCGYCHSLSRVKGLRLRPSEWRKVVKQMQARSPLLISRAEVDVIVRYLVNDLKLVRPAPRRPPPRAPPPAIAAPAPPQPPLPGEEEEEDRDLAFSPVQPIELPLSPEDREAEELGPELLADRCSKCHTLNRVFTKIDSLAAGEAIITRMRKKTGSGISPDDARILLRFLTSRAGR